jgi:hypothetical protein
MLALRRRPIAALSGPFWLSALCAVLAPNSIGYQDLAAFLARQPGVSERWRDHLIASPFGTIHAATFSFSRPIGTAMPEMIGPQLVNLDPRALDVKVWSGNTPQATRPAVLVEYPTVNRRLKGDRMPLQQSEPVSSAPTSSEPTSGEQSGAPVLQPVNAPSPPPANPRAPSSGSRPKNAEQLVPDALAELEAPVEAFGFLPPVARQDDDVTGTIGPVSGPIAGQLSSPLSMTPGAHDDAREEAEDDAAMADRPPEIPITAEGDAVEPPSPFASLSFVEEDASSRATLLYFNGGPMGSRVALERWLPGAEPVIASPSSRDPDVKLAALEAPTDTGPGGETLAGKDDMSRASSPAARLGLAGKPRAKAEKCLADAVYFEARGEPLRGQMAVAQVVMNRVFSGFYPNDVCGVVYQNANRHLACQFTFACEGKDLSRIDEADMWEQAKRIARDMIDGKIWLAEVGHATHYHAYWVHPSWIHEMKKMYQLGVHTFYRPRAWGDGSDAPAWGPVPEAAKSAGPSAENAPAAKDPSATVKSPEAAAKLPQASILPEDVAGRTTRTARLW